MITTSRVLKVSRGPRFTGRRPYQSHVSISASLSVDYQSQFSGSLGVNDSLLGALCPSQSGLMNKHIVKHIVSRFNHCKPFYEKAFAPLGNRPKYPSGYSVPINSKSDDQDQKGRECRANTQNRGRDGSIARVSPVRSDLRAYLAQNLTDDKSRPSFVVPAPPGGGIISTSFSGYRLSIRKGRSNSLAASGVVWFGLVDFSF